MVTRLKNMTIEDKDVLTPDDIGNMTMAKIDILVVLKNWKDKL